MFKKWYTACFKTYADVFIRLAAIYFAIYLINLLISNPNAFVIGFCDSGDTNCVPKTLGLSEQLFVILGILMFAKQFPDLIKDLLGIDLKGNFTLNPIKKIEDNALFGKNLTGAAAGLAIGTVGAFSGAGRARGLTGALGGLFGGKGMAETLKSQRDKNKTMRNAIMDGSTFGGRFGARFYSAFGARTAADKYDTDVHDIDEQIKDIDNEIKPRQDSIADRKAYTDKVKAMEDRAVDKIKNGEAGDISLLYKSLENRAEQLREYMRSNKTANFNGTIRRVTADDVAEAEMAANNYLTTTGMEDYLDITTGIETTMREINSDGTAKSTRTALRNAISDAAVVSQYEDLKAMTKESKTYVKDDSGGTVTIDKATVEAGAAARHKNAGQVTGSSNYETRKYINPAQGKKQKLEQEKAEKYNNQRTAKANETAIK